MDYVVTFWTHLAAMRTAKALNAAGIAAQARPVPRCISASCGTCVAYTADQPCLELIHRDYERVFLHRGDSYEMVAENDAAM